ncbi:tRNA (adenosine(37)-N6)-threonylcarbamoyltransferase complex ATPase subunit type 1 TsaE [Temperatibacter marinus]|uniref:tRNA threonylcarbamoyladenosine biosynthesis protein TsaE n=1 Tax=Temperatibacter marinus TaxID=1456591 RepID=A0AA52EFP3_9PROT|nr:tRNA (adenosine(37)-N6)-threonylcarbamoyltransferase complex ATPase subunit type 1 TsaE [Temperatibacter marinus]WND03931.1 tRNA (adenosine(37)-N6)-threonylcarbamoyltransferase complex ATPase subunit type 1 TsaE [Temperatibacter marinus]
MSQLPIFSFQSYSEQETEAFAIQIGRLLRVGDIVALVGDLGAGKSVTARAIIRFLCEDDAMEVPSPTFTLVQEYQTDKMNIWHSDLYRIEESDEIYELGFEEALDHAALLVEWPDRLPAEFQEDCLVFTLKNDPKDKSRHISLYGNQQWQKRLEKRK